MRTVSILIIWLVVATLACGFSNPTPGLINDTDSDSQNPADEALGTETAYVANQATEVADLRTATAEGPAERIIYGEGLRWRQFVVGDGQLVETPCPTQVDVIITLQANGTAQVETQGNDEFDANCNQTGTTITVLSAFGSYDIITGAITIVNCGQIGGASAEGQILYVEDTLTGGGFQCHDASGQPTAGRVEVTR